MTNPRLLKSYFSDYFSVDKKSLDQYGAFDVSLVADLPLFIDPFLLFQSEKPTYQQLHSDIIQYLKYLRDESTNRLDPGRLKSLYYFSEVKQNYLGFSFIGNSGRGLGRNFATSLKFNLSNLFKSFGHETLTKGIHLEKLCLISEGVGRDTISDFTTNLIKGYLLSYTQEFAKNHINPELRQVVAVGRIRFDYQLGIWVSGKFDLPIYRDDFVILTPKDMLTREDTWISRSEYYSDFFSFVGASTNDQLRADLDAYLKRELTKDYSPKELNKAIVGFSRSHPELIDYFIKSKEENGDKAIERSAVYVSDSEVLFIDQVGEFIQNLALTQFYHIGYRTKAETLQRILFLKDMIENKGCWAIFYNKNKPIPREEDLHIMFRLVWLGSLLDVGREADDGRGPVDYKISFGLDKTLVEFKLASNTHLKDNLQKQLEIYKKASDAQAGYKVIVYFSDNDLARVNDMLDELKMKHDPNIILIDACPKKSASKVR